MSKNQEAEVRSSKLDDDLELDDDFPLHLLHEVHDLDVPEEVDDDLRQLDDDLIELEVKQQSSCLTSSSIKLSPSS